MSETTLVGASPPPVTFNAPRDTPPQESIGEEQATEVETAPAAPPSAVALASLLAMGAAALMLAGVFKGIAPRLAAVAAVAVGAGLVYLSVRWKRQVVQYLALPVGALLGALLVVPEANGQGTANLPGLVVEAIRSGGILQPPIPFDPGWRFIIVVVCVVLGAGTAAIAISLGRPRLAAVLPVPLAMGAELVQPPSDEVIASLVAIVMFISALAVAYGAELKARGVVTSGAFETKRLLRSGGVILLMVAGVLGLSKAGFLFPQPDRHTVVPPERPQSPPPQPDRALFRVTSDKKVPFRVGVIDTYDAKKNAWLLPPYDTDRFVQLKDGAVPGTRGSGDGSFKASVTVADAEGHTLPTVAGVNRLYGISDRLDYDPRTQNVRLTDKRVFKGLHYTMTIPASPSGKQLATAPSPSDNVREFLDVPPAPPEVTNLLKNAPQDPFDRLQTVRNALYTNVVAAGQGKPVDVAPYRVVDMLKGKEATPYEITAGEALLARWAGVPSRIGYGYYGGDKQTDGSYEIHPRHGATWLEAYFQGYGWVPIVGVPLKAKSSNSDTEKNNNPAVKPSENIGLVIYVPVRVTTPLLYFEILQYFLGLVMPYLVAAVILFITYPGFVKILRGLLRRRWARRLGPRQRVIVAYAGFRDLTNDLTYGDPLATPLEYLLSVEPDLEHQELAWLVTRALWGDLRRGLQPHDARRAEQLSRSIIRRLVRAQSAVNLALAFVARTSLRDPYTREVPNPWPRPRPGRAAGGPGGGRRPRLLRRLLAVRPPNPMRLLPRAVGTIIGLLVLTGCGGAADYQGPTSIRPRLVPDRIGTVTLERQPNVEARYKNPGTDSLAQAGQVYLVKHDDFVEGSIQLSLLKRDVRVDDALVYAGVESGIGGRKFTRVRIIPEERVWVKELIDQRIYMWFPPHANVVELVVLRKQFGQHKELVKGLLDYQLGRAAQPFDIPSPPPPVPQASPDDLGNPATIQPLSGLNGPLQGGGSPNPSGSPSPGGPPSPQPTRSP